MMIWLGGIACVAIACRKKDRTTTIRVKDVVIKRIAGPVERSVMRTKILIVVEICSGSVAFLTPIDNVMSSAKALDEIIASIRASNIIKKLRFITFVLCPRDSVLKTVSVCVNRGEVVD